MFTFTDDYSKALTFLSTNMKCFNNFKQWKIINEKQKEKVVKWLTTNNDLEFYS